MIRLTSLILGLLIPVVAGAGPVVVPASFIMGLPKAEMHIHFEGTLEPAFYEVLVQRNHLPNPYPTAAAMRQRKLDVKDLKTGIEVYEDLLSAIRTERDFREVAMAYFERARAQGIVHVEMFFDPQMHTTRGIALATVFAGLQSAKLEAESRLGMTVSYIMCFNRNRSAESAAETLEASRPWLDHIIGVGLDNPEEKDFPQKFAAVYARAKALGLRLTSHCDVNQPNTLAHHWGCLDVLGVERIDHGVNLLDDPKLIEAVRDRKIGITVCPTLLAGDQPGRMTLRANAIKRMLELGLLVTVNSDDPGLLRSLFVGDLMVLVQAEANLTQEQMVTLARNSFQIAWISDQERARSMRMLDDYVAAGEMKH